jgi:hypothetical protein
MPGRHYPRRPRRPLAGQQRLGVRWIQRTEELAHATSTVTMVALASGSRTSTRPSGFRALIVLLRLQVRLVSAQLEGLQGPRRLLFSGRGAILIKRSGFMLPQTPAPEKADPRCCGRMTILFSFVTGVITLTRRVVFL